jgi:hypothetical protein
MADGDRAGGGDERAARELRESRGEKFFARLDDGTEREVKAAKTRGRWERLVSSARALGASSVEARDRDGATLAVVQLEEPAAARVLEVSAEDDEPADRAREVERLLAVVLRAQDAALARSAEQTRAITDAALSVMQAAAERAASMERAVLALVQARERDVEQAAELLERQSRQVAREEARAKDERDREEDDGLDEMAKELVRSAVAPVVMQKMQDAMTKKGTA